MVAGLKKQSVGKSASPSRGGALFLAKSWKRLDGRPACEGVVVGTELRNGLFHTEKFKTASRALPQGHERRGSKLGARVTPGHALSGKDTTKP